MEFWGPIIASLTALFLGGGGGRYISPILGFKPKLEISSLKKFSQSPNVWRLLIKNTGKNTALDVQVDIVEVKDDGEVRENFLPVPLRWTHKDCENRDILPGQAVYLDIFEHFNRFEDSRAIFATRFGRGIGDFTEIKSGVSRIKIAFFERGGISFTKHIDVSWDGGLFFDARLRGGKWTLPEFFQPEN